MKTDLPPLPDVFVPLNSTTGFAVALHLFEMGKAMADNNRSGTAGWYFGHCVAAVAGALIENDFGDATALRSLVMALDDWAGKRMAGIAGLAIEQAVKLDVSSAELTRDPTRN